MADAKTITFESEEDLHGVASDVLHRFDSFSIIEKLIWAFPEITKRQLRILHLYSVGGSYKAISDVCKITSDSVKTTLKRIKIRLNCESFEAMKIIFNTRLLLCLISSN